MKRFLNKLRYVKAKDIWSIFVMLAAIPYAKRIRKQRNYIWLICENGMEARDNGFWLYRYICGNHPETDAVYVISEKSPDYRKVSELGREIVEPGTIRHWAYYMAAEYNISSQKDGKPDAAVCYLLEVYGFWKNKRIFLQHGIIHNDLEFLHYPNTKMAMFICGAEPEYRYVKEHFGYPEGAVKYLGLARFDGLYDIHPKRFILIMPTWRKYIATPGRFSKKFDGSETFIQTNYFKAWEEFFRDRELDEYLEKYHWEILFYPHRNMQRFLPYFSSQSKHIHFADWRKYDVQELLRDASFLVTDYSSVAMDFAYMGKPLLYYQFDLEEFRTLQYSEGYFDYEKNGFGPVCFSYPHVKEKLCEAEDGEFINDEKYLSRIRAFYSIHDNHNCERIYNAIAADQRVKRTAGNAR